MMRPALAILLLSCGVAYGQTTSTSSSTTTNSVGSLSASSNTYAPQTTTYSQVNNPRQHATAFAPGLTSSAVETCFGSASAGFGSAWFGGFTGATTYKDYSCERRLNARVLAQLGARDAGLTILCRGDREIADAFEATGLHCPEAGAKPNNIFYDKSGRRYKQVAVKNAKEAKKLGAIKSDEGTWVVPIVDATPSPSAPVPDGKYEDNASVVPLISNMLR